jgi:hypothetical protein
MGLRELAFGFQLAYDLYTHHRQGCLYSRDLRPFAVLKLMEA